MTFIVLEGADGSGKTTLAKALAAALRAEGREVSLTSEPWDRATLDHARGLHPHGAHVQFAADRARHVARVIRPALARGEVVICDRYALSGVVYALASDPEGDLITAWRVEGVDPGTYPARDAIPRPDLTLVCDAEDAVLDARLGVRVDGDALDANRALQLRVRELYRGVWKVRPLTWPHRVIGTDHEPSTVLARALASVRGVLCTARLKALRSQSVERTTRKARTSTRKAAARAVRATESTSPLAASLDRWEALGAALEEVREFVRLGRAVREATRG